MRAVNTRDKNLFVSLFSPNRDEVAEPLFDNMAESGLHYGASDFETFWLASDSPQSWETQMSLRCAVQGNRW